MSNNFLAIGKPNKHHVKIAVGAGASKQLTDLANLNRNTIYSNNFTYFIEIFNLRINVRNLNLI